MRKYFTSRVLLYFFPIILMMGFTYHGFSRQLPAGVYNVKWLDITNVTVNSNNTLTVNAGVQWGYGKGANSSNILPPNTDGWVEFTAGGNGVFVIGFSANEVGFDYINFNYGIRNEGGAASTYESWVGTSLGTYATGNVFRVSREGSQIKYYKNGAVVRTVSTNPAFELRVKAAMLEGTLPVVTTSRSPQLIVKGTVTGVNSASGTGGIVLDVKGGTSPYTYSWTGGVTTSSLANKATGTYTVTVTDAASLSASKTFRIGYRVFWQNLQGVTESSNILTKTGAAGWGSGASSSNFLAPNTDGWVEFVANLNSTYMVGFSTSGNSYTTNDMAFGIYNEGGLGNLFSNEQWTSTTLGSFFSGDIYRISREGSQMKYYRNGTVIRTISTNAALGLSVKVLVSSGSGPIVNCSMESVLQLKANVSGIESLNGKGSISLTVLGGTTPYTYSWSSGETSAAITDKSAGTYSVTATDAIGRTISKSYSIAYKSIWLPAQNISENGGALIRAGSSWGVGTYGLNYLPANTNGWIEFVAGENATYVMGLSLAGTGFDYSNLSYAFYLGSTGELTAYQDWQATSLGSYQAGDVLKIARVGTQMIYYKNGTAVKTVTVSASQVLYTKASVYSGTTPAPTTQLWISPAEGDVPDLLEFKALKDLYDSLDGSNWTTKTNWPTAGNWPSTADHQQFSTWFGIMVKNGDVVELNFPANKLTGKIPSSIRNLFSLKKFSSTANFISAFPSSFNGLGNLHFLSLRANRITIFPDLSGLKKLDTLTMSFGISNISGEFPQWISSLTNLVYLNLSNSRFSGSIPGNIDNLNKLKYLSLQGTRITGVIPAAIGNLSHLEYFYFSSAQLSPAPLPEFIGNLTNLKTLSLSCKLTGQLPSSLGNLINLNSLILSGNNLNGELTMSIGNLTNLTFLDVSSNELTSIPTSIGNLQKLINFNVSSNTLTSLPSTINQLIKLESFQATRNSFNVNLPDLGGLASLKYFDISNNANLPPWSIPAWLTSFTSLSSLSMANTNLKGVIPNEISQLTQLTDLDLHSNKLSGPIPSSWTVSKISSLELSDNQLSGSLPDIFQNWSVATSVYLSKNKLSGILPPSLSLLGGSGSTGGNLWDFDISNNLIEGVQDNFWEWAKKIAGISLEDNNLRSLPPIPTEITLVTLENSLWLGVRNNQLDFSQLAPLKALNSNFTLTPQKLIVDQDKAWLEVGKKLKIPSREVGGTTTITWYKKDGENWIDITANSEDPTRKTYLRTLTSESDLGSYYWSTVDTKFPGVTIQSGVIDAMYSDLFNDLQVRNTVSVSATEPATNQYKLVVGGDILATRAMIKPSSRWPDYVFSKEHEILPIADLETFITRKGHLPNLASAEEMKRNKVYSVGQMDAQLLEKIEELTLYLIQLNAQSKNLNRAAVLERSYNNSSIQLRYHDRNEATYKSWFNRIFRIKGKRFHLSVISDDQFSVFPADPVPSFDKVAVSGKLLIAPFKAVPENYKLVVGGDILAGGIDIKPVSAWPDYVFSDNYSLLSLPELKQYIQQNHHLPNLLSSQEMINNENYSLGEMDAKLLEKIEELTLYTIQMNKRMVTLVGTRNAHGRTKRDLFRLFKGRAYRKGIQREAIDNTVVESNELSTERSSLIDFLNNSEELTDPPLNVTTLTVTNSLCISCSGIVPSGYKLAVGGTILAAGVAIKAQQQWPDYVFDENYPLASLESVKKFIEKNGHLPNLNSASEMAAQANYDVAQMDAKLLEKIEEITLYLIELDQRLSVIEVKK